MSLTWLQEVSSYKLLVNTWCIYLYTHTYVFLQRSEGISLRICNVDLLVCNLEHFPSPYAGCLSFCTILHTKPVSNLSNDMQQFNLTF